MTDTQRPQSIQGPPPADGRHYVVWDGGQNIGSGMVPFHRGTLRYVITKRGIKAIKAREGKVTP